METLATSKKMFIVKAMKRLVTTMKKMKLSLDTPFYFIDAKDLLAFEQTDSTASYYHANGKTLAEMNEVCKNCAKDYEAFKAVFGVIYYSIPEFASTIVVFRDQKGEVVILRDDAREIIQIF